MLTTYEPAVLFIIRSTRAEDNEIWAHQSQKNTYRSTGGGVLNIVSPVEALNGHKVFRNSYFRLIFFLLRVLSTFAYHHVTDLRCPQRISFLPTFLHTKLRPWISSLTNDGACTTNYDHCKLIGLSYDSSGLEWKDVQKSKADKGADTMVSSIPR